MKKLVLLSLLALPAIAGFSATENYSIKQDDYAFDKIQFFEGPFKCPEEGDRKYATRFTKEKTRYVWTQISVINKLYEKGDQEHDISYKYFTPQDVLEYEIKGKLKIKSEWKVAWMPRGFGADKAGTWPVGRYRVEVWINEKWFGEDYFTIYDDSDKYEVDVIKFFNAGFDAPDQSERKYTYRFHKNDARYIWTQLEIKNLLHNDKDHEHKVTYKYHKPDDKLWGEIKADFKIKSDWEYAILPRGWGWDKKGNWSVGVYRVELWIDDKLAAEDKFTVYDGDETFEFESLRFFECGNKVPDQSKRLYTSSFKKSTARYIYFLAEIKNLKSGIEDHKPNCVAKYYKPDGTLEGEVTVRPTIKSSWKNSNIYGGWGAEKPTWPDGIYKVEIFINGKQVGEGKFTIVNDTPDDKDKPDNPIKPEDDKKSKIDKALDDLKNGDSNKKLKALITLRLYKAKDHSAKIAELLSDSDPEVKASAIKTLARFDAKEYSKNIAALLEDKSAKVKGTALEALDKFEAKDFVNEVLKLTSDSSQHEVPDETGDKTKTVTIGEMATDLAKKWGAKLDTPNQGNRKIAPIE